MGVDGARQTCSCRHSFFCTCVLYECDAISPMRRLSCRSHASLVLSASLREVNKCNTSPRGEEGSSTGYGASGAACSGGCAEEGRKESEAGDWWASTSTPEDDKTQTDVVE